MNHNEFVQALKAGKVSGAYLFEGVEENIKSVTLAALRKAVLAWQDTDAAMRDQLLAHAGYGGAGPPPDGDARAIRRGRSRIDADLDVRAPTTFVIRESWHPRWRATLDGAPIRLRRVSPDFLAVDAPPGHHHLTVRFARPWWTWASWLLWPLAALAAALWARRTRRTPAA